MDNDPISTGDVSRLLEKARDEYSQGTNPRVDLKDDEVNFLAGKARLGDQDAKELIIIWASRLIAPHPGHIQWIKYASVSPEDMWQEGRLAVMTAISKYDPSRGHDFGAYAARIISNTLGEWAERHSLVISVPRHARRRLRREGVVDETTRLAKLAETLPRYLSSFTNTQRDDGHQSLMEETSLALITERGDIYNKGLDEEVEKKEESKAVQNAFFSLEPLEQKILYHRFVLLLSSEKVHKILKIGLVTLAALEQEALVHLKENLGDYLHGPKSTVCPPESC